MTTKPSYILAIETSCDETSFALLKNNHLLDVVTASQIKNHQTYGGVVPELAARLHFEQFDYLLNTLQARTSFNYQNITQIAYTATPGLVGCLKIGQVIAQSLSLALHKPLIKVNHLKGHVYVNFLEQAPKQWPFLGLIVSGGHSEIWKFTSHSKYEKVAVCLDDAAGECFDKIGRLLKIAYPAGPVVEKTARSGQLIDALMDIKMQESADFSFSGLKSAFATYYQKQHPVKSDICLTLQTKVVAVIVDKVQRALQNNPDVQCLVAGGGVLANKALQTALWTLAKKAAVDLLIPPINYCTDNAAMIGAAAYYEQGDNNGILQT